MARNTNIKDILFPVECKPVFFENQHKPISGYTAIIGKFKNDSEHLFSIVSDNYQLITNEMALELGKRIHARLFPDATSDSFEVFNIITPETFGSCHIDIIDKNYKLNVWAQEVYVPFVRIQNSYNRTLPLKFQIGFCRKLCNNGVIFEKNLVSISMVHSKHLFRSPDLLNVDVSHLKKFENDFKKKIKKSTKIPIERKFFLPLAAKVLNQNFNLEEPNIRKRFRIEQKLQEFICAVENYTDKYIRIEQMGENVYTFFNIITDYASNTKHLQARNTNSLQTQCGKWLKSIVEQASKPEFSWEEEVKDHIFINNK